MREILFRGKQCPENEWIYGYVTDLDGGFSTMIDLENTEDVVHSETIGQYTGLTDKNGNKIFEGDILSAHFDDLFPDSESILLVENNGFAFTLKCRDCEPKIIDNSDIPYFKDNFEIIGNVHDNPELLKGE